MRFRKLRIAWSVAWGLAAVLLIALWVRSYSWSEYVAVPITSNHSVSLQSELGRVVLQYEKHPIQRYGGVNIANPRVPIPRRPGFMWGADHAISVPHWFAVGVAAIMATLPWFALLRKPDGAPSVEI
jgi:hypothetical protein